MQNDSQTNSNARQKEVERLPNFGQAVQQHKNPGPPNTATGGGRFAEISCDPASNRGVAGGTVNRNSGKAPANRGVRVERRQGGSTSRGGAASSGSAANSAGVPGRRSASSNRSTSKYRVRLHMTWPAASPLFRVCLQSKGVVHKHCFAYGGCRVSPIIAAPVGGKRTSGTQA